MNIDTKACFEFFAKKKKLTTNEYVDSLLDKYTGQTLEALRKKSKPKDDDFIQAVERANQFKENTLLVVIKNLSRLLMNKKNLSKASSTKVSQNQIKSRMFKGTQDSISKRTLDSVFSTANKMEYSKLKLNAQKNSRKITEEEVYCLIIRALLELLKEGRHYSNKEEIRLSILRSSLFANTKFQLNVKQALGMSGKILL